MFLGLLFSAYAFATGSLSAGLSGIGISLALAIAGAPLMALGTIATNSKSPSNSPPEFPLDCVEFPLGFNCFSKSIFQNRTAESATV